jgi:hypothetical protein
MVRKPSTLAGPARRYAIMSWKEAANIAIPMFEKFPPPILETIEMFFRNPLLGVSADDHVGDLATELELRHPDLSVADAERIAREVIAERSGSSSEAH